MWTKAFWRATAERAIATFLQTLLALWVVDGADILNPAFRDALVAAGVAAVFSVLKSILAALTSGGTASIGGQEVPKAESRTAFYGGPEGVGPGGGG